MWGDGKDSGAVLDRDYLWNPHNTNSIFAEIYDVYNETSALYVKNNTYPCI